jgi:hypothetical protein
MPGEKIVRPKATTGFQEKEDATAKKGFLYTT